MIKLTKQKIYDDAINVSWIVRCSIITIMCFLPSIFILIFIKNITVFILTYLFYGVFIGGFAGIIPLITIIKRALNIRNEMYSIIKYTVAGTFRFSSMGDEPIPSTSVRLLSEDGLVEESDILLRNVFEGEIFYYVYVKDENRPILSYNAEGMRVY